MRGKLTLITSSVDKKGQEKKRKPMIQNAYWHKVGGDKRTNEQVFSKSNEEIGSTEPTDR